ncbi:hypothetical protein QFC22_002767 [Naganishia vaughanmartiniae]|uniref:Uncharacterized protein n=1 Tax=Naganishia vaughanmartiniae TaxID=1424756 RepID=A0ACC2X9Y8_9TREE|nr:hypothetical protein QFC22_002767 [Naganishia vaughanmartiniae]
MSPPSLNYAANTYLSLTFPASSPYIHNPSSLTVIPNTSPSSGAHMHDGGGRNFQMVQLQHVSQVGELEDSHIYQVDGVDKSEWERVREQVLGALKGDKGVSAVQELKARARAKRDEF